MLFRGIGELETQWCPALSEHRKELVVAVFPMLCVRRNIISRSCMGCIREVEVNSHCMQLWGKEAAAHPALLHGLVFIHAWRNCWLGNVCEETFCECLGVIYQRTVAPRIKMQPPSLLIPSSCSSSPINLLWHAGERTETIRIRAPEKGRGQGRRCTIAAKCNFQKQLRFVTLPFPQFQSIAPKQHFLCCERDYLE